MGARRIMWYFGFLLLTVQIAILESAFISKEGAFIPNTHFDQVKPTKDVTDKNVSIDDLRREPLDDIPKNNGVDTFGGINAESNDIVPDGYIPCSDEYTFCPDDCKCCADANGDGLMECCPLGESVSIKYN